LGVFAVIIKPLRALRAAKKEEREKEIFPFAFFVSFAVINKKNEVLGAGKRIKKAAETSRLQRP